ncbi:MAG: flagellar biosynthesis protein FlhF, partial [Desulfomonilia bacterium]|nr:flagellar biosynthesis protein FlhF [Desulfomonilia bacterium]
MQIKTYTAQSMRDALSQVKNELGRDAVIISTREVKDGRFGILSQPMIEIIAAVDYDEGLYNTHVCDPRSPSLRTGYQTDPLPVGDDQIGISSEIIELKKMMRELIAASGPGAQKTNPLRDRLISLGIRQSLVDLILRKLGKTTDMASVKDILSKLIRTMEVPQDPVWVFLGTTGVGKTTTMAKIAASSVFNESKRVAIITLDTYRIGAVDQGKIYAKILNIPFFSVTTPSEFKGTLSRLKDMDRILVDTMGRSALCDEYINGLSDYFAGVAACKILLMPVATRDREMDITMKSFSRLDIRSMIFTKADEAATFGSLITHNLLFRIPISYLTTG